MPWVEFEPTIPAFEGAKTVHALDRVAFVFGAKLITHIEIWYISNVYKSYPYSSRGGP
jgi:hypothetical protein